MLERRRESRAFLRVMAQPVQQFGKTPFRGIHAAAPIDSWKAGAVSRLGDQRGLAPGPVVAPEVVIVQRLQVFVHGDHARPGRVHRDRLDRFALHPRRCQGLLHRFHERPHVIGVALRGVVGIIPLSLQRDLANARTEPPALAVNDGNTHAQRAIVHPGYQCHFVFPIGASKRPSPGSSSRLRRPPLRWCSSWRPRDARSRSRRCSVTIAACAESRPHPRRRTFPADRR